MESIGKVEKLLFLPPAEYCSILTSSINDYYKIMANGMNDQAEKKSIPRKDDIFTKQQVVNDAYVNEILNTTFFTSFDCSVANQEWLPDLLKEPIVNTKQYRFSEFLLMWNQFLSFLTPGEDLQCHNIQLDDYLNNEEVQHLLHQLYCAIPSLNYSELFQNDILYQGVLNRLNVYLFSDNHETEVDFCNLYNK